MIVPEALAPVQLVSRQTDGRIPDGYVRTEDGRIIPWWYTRTGQIVKWSIFLGFITLLTLWMTLGYWHAKKRLRQGLAPMAYHRVCCLFVRMHEW